MQTLARHAETLFWLGRYIERTASLASILQVQTAFDRGRADRDSWSWILTLYDEGEAFRKRYDGPTSKNVIEFYVTDLEHPGSIASSIKTVRENARALRALISSDLWIHINRIYNRFKNLSEFDFREQRLYATCELVQTDCYALHGICDATLYRDAGWQFLELGIQVERADQMSRLLDVRYAQILSRPQNKRLMSGDFIHWSMLLRACAGHHAFKRLVAGPLEAEKIARFLIFEKNFVRSIAHCERNILRAITELELACVPPKPEVLREKASALGRLLKQQDSQEDVVPTLHHFNDAVQGSLADLTDELDRTYFSPDIAVKWPDDSPMGSQIQVQGGKNASARNSQSTTTETMSQQQS